MELEVKRCGKNVFFIGYNAGGFWQNYISTPFASREEADTILKDILKGN